MRQRQARSGNNLHQRDQDRLVWQVNGDPYKNKQHISNGASRPKNQREDDQYFNCAVTTFRSDHFQKAYIGYVNQSLMKIVSRLGFHE